MCVFILIFRILVTVLDTKYLSIYLSIYLSLLIAQLISNYLFIFVIFLSPKPKLLRSKICICSNTYDKYGIISYIYRERQRDRQRGRNLGLKNNWVIIFITELNTKRWCNVKVYKYLNPTKSSMKN